MLKVQFFDHVDGKAGKQSQHIFSFSFNLFRAVKITLI